MSNLSEELHGLCDFLRRLETKELVLSRRGVDVSQEEIAVLKREIDHLERIVARCPQAPEQ
jgi:hypothetical protein